MSISNTFLNDFSSENANKEIKSTPFIYAITQSSKITDILELMLQRGSSINEKDEFGRTPLMYAIMLNSVELT